MTKDLPYGINKEYIDIIKPCGLLRTWFQSEKQDKVVRASVKHQLTLTMELADMQSSTSQDIGTTSAPMSIDEGHKIASHVGWDGHEIAFAFSKADSAESKLTQTGDTLR